MKCLSIMLVSLCGVMQAADLDANTVLNDISAIALEPSARRLNSMMEAYMMGKFFPSQKDGHLAYAYHAVTDGHQEHLEYDDQVKDINMGLENIFNTIFNGIGNCATYGFHAELHNRNKEQQIAYLKDVKEFDKTKIQALRLYDFIRCINIDLPDSVLVELTRIENDAQLSKKEKKVLLSKLFAEQQGPTKAMEANRKELSKAFKDNDAQQVLKVCNKTLHIGTFLSLNAAIHKLITDIETGTSNNIMNP